jgi:hypothetical protein
MEQLTARILERSSDAVLIIHRADSTVLGFNEAFFAVTGHPQHELVGRPVDDLLVQLVSVRDSRTGEARNEFKTLSDAVTMLWTRSGELRSALFSAIDLSVDGEIDTICALREIRDPTPRERHQAARERFTRAVKAGHPWREAARSAIRALGESLRWEFGALWLMPPDKQSLRCAVVWRSPLANLKTLEEASWRTAAPPGVGLVGRTWQRRQATWVTDALTEPDPGRASDQVGELVRGWFGFPVWAGDDVVGVVEFFSSEVRQPDEELLQMSVELGELLGGLLREFHRPHQESPVASSPTPKPPPGPSRLTLKAVSRRTGIPAATLRTWERRYGFVRPTRSPSGHRLYGEEEIALVLEIKQLLEQGVRIGEAMTTVRGLSDRPLAAG